MGGLSLLDLMGGVALRLWGLRMVLTGVLRAFGPHLRLFLGILEAAGDLPVRGAVDTEPTANAVAYEPKLP